MSVYPESSLKLAIMSALADQQFETTDGYKDLAQWLFDWVSVSNVEETVDKDNVAAFPRPVN